MRMRYTHTHMTHRKRISIWSESISLFWLNRTNPPPMTKTNQTRHRWPQTIIKPLMTKTLTTLTSVIVTLVTMISLWDESTGFGEWFYGHYNTIYLKLFPHYIANITQKLKKSNFCTQLSLFSTQNTKHKKPKRKFHIFMKLEIKKWKIILIVSINT